MKQKLNFYHIIIYLYKDFFSINSILLKFTNLLIIIIAIFYFFMIIIILNFVKKL